LVSVHSTAKVVDGHGAVAGMRSRFFFGPVAAAASFLLVGLDCNSTGGASGDSNWQDALAQLASHGSGVYSFRFTSAPPNGMYAHFALHDTTPDEACARYSGAADSTSDYWFVDLEFGGAGSGAYSVVTSDVLDGNSMAANVSLLHRKNGAYVENYPAIGGSVTLEQAPSTEGSNAGASVTARVHATFASSPFQQVGCSGGEAADSSVVDTVCTCRDPAGATTTCVPDGGFDYCCPIDAGASVPLELVLTAQPCPGMCRVAVGFSDYCAVLNP
jgi:hypothetical protein